MLGYLLALDYGENEGTMELPWVIGQLVLFLIYMATMIRMDFVHSERIAEFKRINPKYDITTAQRLKEERYGSEEEQEENTKLNSAEE